MTKALPSVCRAPKQAVQAGPLATVTPACSTAREVGHDLAVAADDQHRTREALGRHGLLHPRHIVLHERHELGVQPGCGGPLLHTGGLADAVRAEYRFRVDHRNRLLHHQFMGRVDHRHRRADPVGIDFVSQAVQEIDHIFKFQQFFLDAHDIVAALDKDNGLDRQFEVLDIADDKERHPGALVLHHTVGGQGGRDGDSRGSLAGCPIPAAGRQAPSRCLR